MASQSLLAVRAAAGRDRLRAFTLVELLVVLVIISILVSLLMPAVQAARESGRRAKCANNMKQIVLALHEYHEAYDALPYGSAWNNCTKIATGPTWVTMILPFLDQQWHYNMFNFTKPMCDPANLPAVQTSVPALICPSDPASQTPVMDCRCQICVFSGKSDTPRRSMALWYPGSMGPTPCGICEFCPVQTPSPTNYCCQGSDYGNNGIGSGMFHRWPISVTLASVTDGMSNTILCGETIPDQTIHCVAFCINMPTGATNIPMNHLVNWDKFPQSGMNDSQLHTLNPKSETLGYKSYHPSGCQFMMCDGHVVFLREDIDYRLYNSLGTRAGAEGLQLP